MFWGPLNGDTSQDTMKIHVGAEFRIESFSWAGKGEKAQRRAKIRPAQGLIFKLESQEQEIQRLASRRKEPN